jgi:hypothetical protein
MRSYLVLYLTVIPRYLERDVAINLNLIIKFRLGENKSLPNLYLLYYTCVSYYFVCPLLRLLSIPCCPILCISDVVSRPDVQLVDLKRLKRN